MSNHVDRYLPEQALPPYSYVPGLSPHPKRDPSGHGCPGPLPTQACQSLRQEWPNCSMYLWGFDLFNAGYYWEAHEAWEDVWIAADRRGEVADFVKSLIKLAAAGVKARQGQLTGIRRHAERSLELLDQLIEFTQEDRYCGCRLGQLQSLARNAVNNAESMMETAQVAALPVLFDTVKLELPLA